MKTEAAAGINEQINFQGKMTDDNGLNVANGTYQFVFSFYTLASGGSAVWTETVNLSVTDGIFQHNLGSVTPLPGSVDFDSDNIYLGITFNSDPDGEMSPRIQLTASPYAFNADKLDGLDSSALVQLSPSGTQTGNIDISGNVAAATATISTSLLIGNASTAGSLAIYDGTSDYGVIQTAALSTPRSYTLPNASGTFCLDSGNCGGGGDILQNGNSFGGTMTIGTNDSNSLALETAGTTRLTISSAGNFTQSGGFYQMSGTSTSNYKFYLTGTVQSASGSVYGFQNDVAINASAASGAYGLINTPTIHASSGSIADVFGFGGRVDFQAGYAGTVTNVYSVAAARPTGMNGIKVQNYVGIASLMSNSGSSGNSDNTSSTLNNYGLRVFGGTAAAGVGGTLNNYGARITLSTGATTNTTNYGLFIDGNGGGSNNWALYSTSTANSLISGTLNVVGQLSVGTVDTTGTLLVLDTKTGAGDPAGSAGGMYYNSNANAFRIYENGAWRNIGDVLQNGNSFAGAMTIGTNDNQALNFETNGTTKATLAANGNLAVDTNTLYVDAVNNGVAIGKTSVALTVDATNYYKLDIQGTTGIVATNIKNTSTGDASFAEYRAENDAAATVEFGIGGTGLTGGAATLYGNRAYIISSAASGMTFNTEFGGDMLFATADTARLTLDTAGNLTSGVNILGSGAATGTTGTTEATARTNVTTVTLTAAGSFANNDVIFINNAGQDYYTRIVSGGGTTTLTVSPAVSYDVSAAVTKYNVQNIGATSSDYTTLSTRFFQGYFLGGVVTGAGSTTLSDGNLSSTGALTLKATDLKVQNTSNTTFISLDMANNRLEVVGDIVSKGTAWTSRTSAANNNWSSIAYGNGLFVAVSYTGTGNRVMTSQDGVTWTARTSAADNSWMSVTYGNGLFVAIAQSGTGNRVMTSPDGITWTIRASASDNNWNSVTYGNGLFVAVSNSVSNQVMTSPDAINWTSRSAPNTNNWQSVTYGNGLFVAVAWSGTGNRVMTSPDGITWTARTSAADNAWQSVTYGNGLFVAVSYSGTGNRVMTSPDGITWTSRTSAADNGWYSVIYGNGLFVAIANSGTGNRVMTSSDGITWTIRTSAADNSWYGVAYGNGLFAAVSITGTGNRVMTSGKADLTIASQSNTYQGGLTVNGSTTLGSSIVDSWTSRTSAANNDWRSVAYGNSVFVAVASTGTGNRVMTSPDGITWTIRTSAADNDWYGVTYGNGLFVAIAGTGTGNRVMTSPDGITWTIRTSVADNVWTSVAYGSGLFVAVSVGGTNRVMTSPDGITWTARTAAAANQWTSVAYGSGLFVAVSNTGTGNRVMTSPDGITWTSRTSAADNQWQAVTYGNGLFVAVGVTGTGNRVMTSPDGITWTTRTNPVDRNWNTVTYGNGLFVAAGTSGTADNVMTSPDGITWTTRVPAALNGWTSVAYANSMFVAVSASGTGNRVMSSGGKQTALTSQGSVSLQDTLSVTGLTSLADLSVSGRSAFNTYADLNSTVTIGAASNQYPVNLYLRPSTHATSRRTAISIDDWLVGQDMSGNGTKDFFIYQGAAGVARFSIDTSGNVGIGTASVTDRALQATGIVSIKGGAARLQIEPGGGGTTNLWNIDNSGGTMRFFRENYSATGAGSGGVVRLQLNDAGTGTTTIAGNNACTIGSGTGTTSCTSDYRKKHDIQGTTGNLDKVLQLNPVSYYWNTDPDNTTKRIGLIAQDVKELFPEAVDMDSEGFYTLDYSVLVSPLIGAVKELNVQTLDNTHEIGVIRDDVTTLTSAMNGYASAYSVQSLGDGLVNRIAALETGNFTTITVAGPAIFQSTLTVMGDTFVQSITVAGKIITTGTTPAAVLGVNTGTGATTTVTGNDTAGDISFTTGATDLASGEQLTITFNVPFGAKPRVNLTATSPAAAGIRYYTEQTATEFKIYFIDAPEANKQYGFNYFVVQ